MTGFDEAHTAFIRSHLARREGERSGRLERGHAHMELLFAKNVWWPLKGQFDNLHPEYEVLNWRGRSYFADYCYMPKLWKILIEIKGFGEHVTNMDRQKYCNELNRETFLGGMGFRVISFAYGDVAYRPELCVNLLRMYLSQYESSPGDQRELVHYLDREVLRFAVSLARPVRPVEVAQRFGMNRRTASKHLRRLAEKGWLQPVLRGAGKWVLYYEVTKKVVRAGFIATRVIT